MLGSNTTKHPVFFDAQAHLPKGYTIRVERAAGFRIIYDQYQCRSPTKLPPANQSYRQKYRKEWEKENGLKRWLQPCGTDTSKAYCKYCKVVLNAKLSDLNKHHQTGKHIAAAKPFSSNRQQTIAFEPASTITAQQRKEGQLALYAAVHTSISSIDHLSNLHKDTSINVKLKRSKCTSITTNVLGPHFSDSLISDVGDGNYSLLLDESTDISMHKMLGVAIRYYSPLQHMIICTFLSLIHIENGTAECMVSAIKNLLKSVGLKLEKLVGIGTDNASAMVGVNSGVYALLKQEVPHLILIRCVCHSLQLAVSKASKFTFPRHIEFLVSETYNWFAHSSIRQLSYAEIYSTINDGEVPLKVLKVADTRWLSIEPAVKRILDQWLTLKTHFEITRLKDNCFWAEKLYMMYCDGQNKVFLSFLYPILNMVQKTNKHFESMSVDPTKLLSDLKLLYSSIANKIILPTARIDIYSVAIDKYLDPNPALGYAFETACTEANIGGEQKSELKSRCVAFLVALAKEIQNRLPDNIRVLEKMSTMAVDQCLKPQKAPITELAKMYFPSDILAISQIEIQWADLHSLKWQQTTNTEKFWDEVYHYRDASGENPFSNLVDLAFRVLCLPHSNADIERVFSQMNLIKTKLRNRMKLPLLVNLLHVRFGLRRLGKCCHDYVLPDSVLKNLCNNQTYVPRVNYAQEEVDDDNLEALLE